MKQNDILLWIGAFGLLVLGIFANFTKMPWYVLIPLELIFMAMVIVKCKK